MLLDKRLKCDACNNNTTGAHCEKCSKFHYGDARNGGTCEECSCNNHAVDCNSRTGENLNSVEVCSERDTLAGSCFCDVRGIVGTHCDECDIENGYDHRLNDTCFFPLKIDWAYKFLLDPAVSLCF